MKALNAALVSVLLSVFPGSIPVEVQRELYLMGTTVSMETSAADRPQALQRLESFLRIIEDTEGQLSTWREGSTLSRLNRQKPGIPMTLDRSVCRLLIELRDWSARTDGTFDPTVGSLIDVWGLRGTPQVPERRQLEAALQRSGFSRLVTDPETCEATRLAEVRLDAGAFGKGEALDRVAASDEGRRSSWMIDMGGQIMVHRAPGTDRAWSLDLAHPSDRRRPVLTVSLSSGSLASSGGSERDRETPAGDRIGHIIDPRTGEAVSRAESVVVWNSSALVADVLSTALYVMGPEEGLPWAEGEDVVAGFLVPEGDGFVLRSTSAFRNLFLD